MTANVLHADTCRVAVGLGRKVLTGPAAQGQFRAGEVVELEAFLDDYVDIHADGRLVARGKCVLVEGRLAVRVQEVLATGLETFLGARCVTCPTTSLA
jgi:hypothetical protein